VSLRDFDHLRTPLAQRLGGTRLRNLGPSCLVIGCVEEPYYHRHRRLLRARRQRPRRRTAEQRDELAPFQSLHLIPPARARGQDIELAGVSQRASGRLHNLAAVSQAVSGCNR
jgi:hypothetical protein